MTFLYRCGSCSPLEGDWGARVELELGVELPVYLCGAPRSFRRRSSTFSLRCLVEWWIVLDTLCMDIRVFFEQETETYVLNKQFKTGPDQPEPIATAEEKKETKKKRKKMHSLSFLWRRTTNCLQLIDTLV